MAIRLLALAISAVVTSAGRGPPKAHGFVKSLEFKHRLRVCNAYPYDEGMEVYRGHSELLTVGLLGENDPMPYKSCRDFSSPLKPGDKLQFKVGTACNKLRENCDNVQSMNAGTFSISDLPNNDAVLMLVIHRADTLTNAVSFESHVFANLLNAQMAIIDTYKGTARASAQIVDADSLAGMIEGKGVERKEKLRFHSVVALNMGLYEVEMVSAAGKTVASSTLVALDRESYVVLRTGVEAQQGKSYPEDMVVYPQSDKALLIRSGTPITAHLSVLASVAPLVACIIAAVGF